MSSNDDETAPLLDPQNGIAKKQGQEKKCNCTPNWYHRLSQGKENGRKMLAEVICGAPYE